jgi:carbon monoxide dehydrogenase subunit G
MDMTGSQRIEASREQVWRALNDPEILKSSIPGCESLEKTSDTEMSATVTLKVGPIKASFKGKVTFSDMDPPNGYTISGEGSGGLAGFAKGGATVKLEADGNATILHYDVKAQVGGKLAQLGARLIDATAKKLAGDFFENFGATFAPKVEVVAPPEKTGWMKKVFGSSAATLILAGGLLLPDCCLNGSHAHADSAFSFPICRAISKI